MTMPEDPLQNLLPPGSYSIPSSSQSQNILLDSSIRDWVVLPLLILMIEAGLLRHYLSVLLKPTNPKKIPLVEHRVKNALARAGRLRSGGMGFLSRERWESRRLYWVGTSTDGAGGGSGNVSDDEKGYLQEEMIWIEEEEEEQKILKEEAQKNDAAAGDNGNGDAVDDDMPNPMAMMDGMKGQVLFMVQNMVMMQGIGYFFQGYVLVKVPMPLTMGFKMMFQRGLDLSTLETSYVSSVSWYFLVMFGLRSFFRLIIEAGAGSAQQEVKESAMMQADFGTAMAPPGVVPKFDAAKAIKAEIDNLELTRYKGIVDDAERRLLGKKMTRKKIIGKAAEPGYDIFGAGAGAGGPTGTGSKSASKSSKRSLKKKVPGKVKAN